MCVCVCVCIHIGVARKSARIARQRSNTYTHTLTHMYIHIGGARKSARIARQRKLGLCSDNVATDKPGGRGVTDPPPPAPPVKELGLRGSRGGGDSAQGGGSRTICEVTAEEEGAKETPAATGTYEYRYKEYRYTYAHAYTYIRIHTRGSHLQRPVLRSVYIAIHTRYTCIQYI